MLKRLREEVPKAGRIVWCFREYTPKGCLGPKNGVTQRAVRLAMRQTTEPETISDDAGANAWWHGVNDCDGLSWSDTTVYGWREIDEPARCELCADFYTVIACINGCHCLTPNVQDHRPCAPLAQGPRGSQS